MYFPNDPLFAYDPILNSVTDETARQRLVAAYDIDLSVPEWSLGYRWDIVLGRPRRHLDGGLMTTHSATPSQTVGPFYGYALPFPGGPRVAPERHPDAIRSTARCYDGAGDPVPDALAGVLAGRPGRPGAGPGDGASRPRRP